MKEHKKLRTNRSEAGQGLQRFSAIADEPGGAQREAETGEGRGRVKRVWPLRVRWTRLKPKVHGDDAN